MTTLETPLISIVTPSYNQAAFIQNTLLSVLNQSYPHIEYIVVDGGSTDGTLEIIEPFSDRLTLVSEPDRGQADAINKGFRIARGELLAWLNSDDQYLEGAIETVVNFFKAHPQAAFVYGATLTMDDNGSVYGLSSNVRPCNFHNLVHFDDSIVQPGAFWRADVWQTLGPLDDSLKYTLDYDFWIKVSQKYTLHHIPSPLAIERIYTRAKTALGGLERLEEIEALVQRHGGDGLPRAFHAEATATYTLQAIRHLGGRNQDSFRANVAKARQYLHLSPRYIVRLGLFFMVMILMGKGGIPRLRLLKSRFTEPKLRIFSTDPP